MEKGFKIGLYIWIAFCLFILVNAFVDFLEKDEYSVEFVCGTEKSYTVRTIKISNDTNLVCKI